MTARDPFAESWWARTMHDLPSLRGGLAFGLVELSGALSLGFLVGEEVGGGFAIGLFVLGASFVGLTTPFRQRDEARARMTRTGDRVGDAVAHLKRRTLNDVPYDDVFRSIRRSLAMGASVHALRERLVDETGAEEDDTWAVIADLRILGLVSLVEQPGSNEAWFKDSPTTRYVSGPTTVSLTDLGAEVAYELQRMLAT